MGVVDMYVLNPSRMFCVVVVVSVLGTIWIDELGGCSVG